MTPKMISNMRILEDKNVEDFIKYRPDKNRHKGIRRGRNLA